MTGQDPASGRWPPRPRLSRSFYKAHGLGNDYLVFEEGSGWTPTPRAVSRVCHPHRGLGSDGIVVLLTDRSDRVFRARMFNPDGSEFERSGNGLRILGSFLSRSGESPPYIVDVGGDRVTLHIHATPDPHHDVSVDMGRARTGAQAVDLDPGCLDPDGRMKGPEGESLRVVPVSVGNPHLVVLGEDVTTERLSVLGPFLVSHPGLAHGANVQLAEMVDERSCRALIWERGVGPTDASGTSACAVAVALGAAGALGPGEVDVHTPGGVLSVLVAEDGEILLRGPVAEVAEGVLARTLVDE